MSAPGHISELLLSVPWEIVGFGTLRALGALAVLPFPNGTFPAQLRFLFGGLLGAVIATRWCAQGGAEAHFSLGASVFEFVLGSIIALPAALVVSGAGMLGELFDAGRGQSIGSFYDPLIETQDSLSAALHRNLVWTVLLVGGFGEDLAAQMVRSADLFPLGLTDTVSLAHLTRGLVVFLNTGLMRVFTMFLPIAFLYLAIDVALGFIGKIVPNVINSNEAFVLKSAAGMALLWLAWRSGLADSLQLLATPALERLAHDNLHNLNLPS